MTTTTQVVETSVTVNNNRRIQDYVQPDDHTQPTNEMTSGSNLSHYQKSLWQLGRPGFRPPL